jgi:hypothetical protein
MGFDFRVGASGKSTQNAFPHFGCSLAGKRHRQDAFGLLDYGEQP